MAEQQVKNLYAVLGLDSDATAKEIQRAYRNLAKTKHPDISKEPDANEVFQKIKEAHEVLSDPQKKKEYDDFVKNAANGDGQTFTEIFDMFYPGIQGVHSPIRGEDIEVIVDFKAAEVKQPTRKTFKFNRFINCKECSGNGFDRKLADMCTDCHGKGFELINEKTPFGKMNLEKRCETCDSHGYINRKTCESCKGNGKVEAFITFTFTLPAGSKEGDRITLAGRGDEGLNGGINGNLFIVLRHDEGDTFTIRNEFDLHQTIKVPLLLSLTGGTMTIVSPTGKNLEVPIPRLMKQGHQIVLPDEGLLNKKNGFHGILVLTAEIVFPEDLPEEKAKLLIEILK